MDTHTEHVFAEAIKLPPDQRAALADALLESIPFENDASRDAPIDPEIGQAWGDEVKRRIADVAAGRVTMIPHEGALPRRRDDG